MRNILRNPFFIAVAATVAVGSACGLLVGLYTKDIGDGLAIALSFTLVALLAAGLVAFLLAVLRTLRRRRPDGSTPNVQPAGDSTTAATAVARDGPPSPGPATRPQVRADSPWTALAVWAVLPIGLVALWGLVMWLSEGRQDEEALGWPSTTGRVISSHAWGPTGDGDYWFDVSYEYEAAGRHVGESNSWGPYFEGDANELVESYPPGSEVQVYYDPEAPGRSALWPGQRTDSLRALLTFFLISIGVVFVLFLLLGIRRRWLRRRRRAGSTLNVRPASALTTVASPVARDGRRPPGAVSDPEDKLQPAYADYRQATDYVCRRCGRAVGPAILACPDLPSGNCAFRKADAPPTASRHGCYSGIAVLGGLALVLVSFVSAREFAAFGSPGFWGVLLGGSALSVFLLRFGLLGMFRTYTVLQDSTSGLAWTRARSLGLTRLRALIAQRAPLPAPLLSLPPSPFPTSVVALSDPDSNTAVALFRAALLGLWARGYVRIHPYRRYMARGRARYKPPQDVYAVSLVAGSGWASADGELERKVLLALSTWPTAKRAEYGLWPRAYEIWPYGPSICDLVCSACGEAGGSAKRWATGLIAHDAATHGWGQLRDWVSGHYALDPEQAAGLRLQRASLNALSSRVAREHPRFSEVLDKEIKRAVSRVESLAQSSYPYYS